MTLRGELEGQVAWITGGGSGIGRAVAEQLARRGAHVAVSGRREERLRQVAQALTRLGPEAMAAPCDVRHDDQITRAVGAVVEAWGRLDIVVANAGFAVAGRVAELSGEDWRRQLETNVVGAALTVQQALPHLRLRQGRVVLVGSVAAFVCAPKLAAYNASKHALRAIGQTLAIELHGSGVSCTTVHPGYVDSEIAQVDNLGQHDPSRPDRRPARLMWPADKAAAVIVDAALKRRREIVFTGHGKLGAFLGQHFPDLAYFVATRGMM